MAEYEALRAEIDTLREELGPEAELAKRPRK
jgi:hypothetical protein